MFLSVLSVSRKLLTWFTELERINSPNSFVDYHTNSMFGDIEHTSCSTMVRLMRHALLNSSIALDKVKRPGVRILQTITQVEVERST